MSLDDGPPPASLFTLPSHRQAAHDFLFSLSLSCSPSARPPLFYPFLLHPHARVDVGEAVDFLRSIHLTSPHVEDPSYHLSALRHFYGQRTAQQHRDEEAEEKRPPSHKAGEASQLSTGAGQGGAEEPLQRSRPFASPIALLAPSPPPPATSAYPSPLLAPLPLPVVGGPSPSLPSSSVPSSPLAPSAPPGASPYRTASASPTAGWFYRALSAPTPPREEETAALSSSSSTSTTVLPPSHRSRHSLTLPLRFVLPGQSSARLDSSLPNSGSPSPTDALPFSLRRARTFVGGTGPSVAAAAPTTALSSTVAASLLPATPTLSGHLSSSAQQSTGLGEDEGAAGLSEGPTALGFSVGGPIPFPAESSTGVGSRSLLPLPTTFVSAPPSSLHSPLAPQLTAPPALADLREQWEKDLVGLSTSSRLAGSTAALPLLTVRCCALLSPVCAPPHLSCSAAFSEGGCGSAPPESAASHTHCVPPPRRPS